MRIDELLASHRAARSLCKEEDHLHGAEIARTGFFGKRGAGCVIMARDTGRFLIAHRSGEVHEPDTWGTWGGAIERSESPIEAVKREVREETGFEGPVTIEPLYVFQHDRFTYHNFLVMVDAEFEPVLDWENQGSLWCDWGRWPTPLHFGLASLLGDPRSAIAMHHAARKVRPAAR